jgi:hypothetical protein
MDLAGWRQKFPGQHLQMPHQAAFRRMAHQAIEDHAQFRRCRAIAVCETLQVGQVDDASVSLDQHRLIQSVTAAEVVVDQGHARLGPLRDRFGGGLCVAVGGKEFPRRLQDVLAGRIPVGAAFAGGLGHGVVGVKRCASGMFRLTRD